MPEAVLAPADIDAIALTEQIDRQALFEAAEREQTVASIADLHTEKLHLLVSVGRVNPERASEIRSELQRLQERRMGEIRFDTAVKIAKLSSMGAAGLFNGQDVILDVEHIDEKVYLHERKHREDGLPEDLDADLAPQTGLRAVDDKLEDVGTKRDRLEERAMDAADEVPEAYRETHWRTVKDMEKRGKDVGIDVEEIDASLIESRDAIRFERAMVTLAVRELAEEDPEELGKLEAEAEKSHVDPAVRQIIRDTRYSYEYGPKAAEPQYANAA